MTNTPHPNRDALIALAEGKTVQYKGQGCDWADYRPSYRTLISPIDPDSDVLWRVKPEPIERWLVIDPDGDEYMCYQPPAPLPGHRAIRLREVES